MSPHITTISTESELTFAVSMRVLPNGNGFNMRVTVRPLKELKEVPHLTEWVIEYSDEFVRQHQMNHFLLLADARSQIVTFMAGSTDGWTENPRGTLCLKNIKSEYLKSDI